MIEYIEIGKYITAFDETPDNRKTKIYRLCNSKNELIHLGIIKWYGAWRQYCFFSEDNIVFNKECLNDISKFLDQLNESKGRSENNE